MTPGYDGQVISQDCDCEDFPCCSHGLTQSDYDDEFYDPYYSDENDDYSD